MIAALWNALPYPAQLAAQVFGAILLCVLAQCLIEELGPSLDEWAERHWPSPPPTEKDPPA